MPCAFIQAMSFFTSAMTSGPMPSPASRRRWWVGMVGPRDLARHGRARPGHPRLALHQPSKTWIPGTRPGMTTERFVRIAKGPRCGWQDERAGEWLKPAEPVVALLLPVARIPVIDHRHVHHVLGVLEAELGRDAHLHREAVL